MLYDYIALCIRLRLEINIETNNNIMKKVFLFSAMLLLALCSFAQNKVNYYNIGKNANVSAWCFDDKKFIVLAFSDNDEKRLIESPIIKIQLFDGSILRLSGAESSYKTAMRPTTFKGGAMGSKEIGTHYVMLLVSDEQIKKLNTGIMKIVINTIPELFYESYSSDKFGAKLHEDLMNWENELSE